MQLCIPAPREPVGQNDARGNGGDNKSHDDYSPRSNLCALFVFLIFFAVAFPRREVEAESPKEPPLLPRATSSVPSGLGDVVGDSLKLSVDDPVPEPKPSPDSRKCSSRITAYFSTSLYTVLA